MDILRKVRRWLEQAGDEFGEWVKQRWPRVHARLFPPAAKTFDELFPSELMVVRKRRTNLGKAEDELPRFQCPSKILATELRQLKRSRWQPRQDCHSGLVGLALSGGGIRSATFNLGIIQALEKYGIFENVDYLSTVSGGGYIGSSVSSVYSRPDGVFPFAHRIGVPEKQPFRHLREYSNYLAPHGLIDLLRIAAVLLRGILTNLVVIAPLIFLAAIVTVSLNPTPPDLASSSIAAPLVEWLDGFLPIKKFAGESFVITKLLAILFVCFLVLYQIVQYLFHSPFIRNFFQIISWIPSFLIRVLNPALPNRVRAMIQRFITSAEWRVRNNVWRTAGLILGVTAVAAFIELQPRVIDSLAIGDKRWAVLKIEAAKTQQEKSFAKWIEDLKTVAKVVAAPEVTLKAVASFEASQEELKVSQKELDKVAVSVAAALLAATERPEAVADPSEAIAVFEKKREVFEKKKKALADAELATTDAFGAVAAAPNLKAAQADEETASDEYSTDWEIEALAIRALAREKREKAIEFLDWGRQLSPWLAPSLPLLFGLLASKLARPRGRWLRNVGIYVLVAVGFLAVWLVYLVLTRWAISLPEKMPSFLGASQESVLTWYWYAVAASMVYLYFVDINDTSLHKFYRDRLSKAYLFSWDGGQLGFNDGAKLSELNADNNGPYHLINTALNVQSSREDRRRGRKAESFIFSKLFTGSDATGYCDTSRMEDARKDIDLATTMAISGAAASPQMGMKTIRPLAFIAALFNIRLGYWLPNPGRVAEYRLRWGKRRVPPFYLFREMFGWLSETGWRVYLTDGGHFENIGLYELLRRECRLIIACDGESDPNFEFGGFATAQRLARIDMGITIEMEGLDEIKAGRQHHATGKIRYGNDREGRLIYLKSSILAEDSVLASLQKSPEEETDGSLIYLMSGQGVFDESAYIARYKAQNPSFPHETTGDQFFNEEQFECYRALGYQVAKSVFG